ncbi:hypothetical protein [Cochleicola gelatinilyticus]|uniref:Peptidase M56 domain-containing protein n=1 Tax=Cochleicola gelatinilyticus TaxID=1763537 RepID=A0A167IIJ7_9FLAO|nr:hypothetical protein [Cochleicola gelatinilyticus]OAB79687.1 hypothetical protein ULVI_02770 [Cochleicola gelatinilyticus]
MIILVNRFLLRKHFTGISLWPFVIVRSREMKKDLTFLNHERIHLKQQTELLVVPFYIWYVVEYGVRLLQYKDRYKAYKNISFEREAYANEGNLQYLEKRHFWNFLTYL